MGHGPLGPIHTTAGDMKMSEDEKVELGHNLTLQQRKNLVTKLAKGCLETAELFFEAQTYKYVPTGIIIQGNDKVAEWFQTNGFSFIQDKFTSIVKRRGQVIGRSDFPVKQEYQAEVLEAMEIMANTPQDYEGRDYSHE